MHEEKIGRIGFLSFDLRNARGHGHGADPGRTDERVDRVVAGEKIEQLGREDAAGGAESEGDDAEGDDEEGLRAEKTFPGHGDADAGAEENGHHIDDFILRGFEQAFGHAAFAQEIPQHEHADERGGCGDEKNDGDGDEEGKDEFFQPRNLAEGLHADLALLHRGQRAHDGRLDERDEGHVGVGGHGHGAEEFRGELGGEEDGSGSVRPADDADGGGLLRVEAE